MTKQEFEDKYLGKKIRLSTWGKGEWVIAEIIEDMNVYGLDDIGKIFYCSWDYDDWELYEEEPEVIQEKTIDDFPLVEVSWDGKYWEQVRYTYTDSEGSFFDSEGEYWNHMRPIQKVDVNDLKNKARLV